MQGVLAVLVILMIIFILPLSNSKATEKSNVKKEKTETSQQKQAQMKKESVKKYDLNPFDLSRTTLPKNYLGHDLINIYEALEKRKEHAKKDEYETTEQYNQRIQDLDRKPLIGKLTVDDLFSFVVTTGTTQKIHGTLAYRKILVYNEYDADSQTLTLMLRTTNGHCFENVHIDGLEDLYKNCFENYHADYSKELDRNCCVDEVRIHGPELYYNESTYMGSNAYGASTEVRRIIWKSIELRFPPTSALPVVGIEDESIYDHTPWIMIDLKNVTPETAKNIRDNLCIAFIYKLKEPYLKEETGRTTPRRDFPIDMSIIAPHVLAISKEIWIFNKTNGEILLKVKTSDAKTGD